MNEVSQLNGFLLMFGAIVWIAFYEHKRAKLKLSIDEYRNAFKREIARLEKNPKNFRFNRWGPTLKIMIEIAEYQCENDYFIGSLQALLASYKSAIELIEREVYHKAMGHNQISIM